MKSGIEKIQAHTLLPLAILLAANIVIGTLVVENYGVSWDENGLYRYASNTLQIYQKFFNGETVTLREITAWFNLHYYGPLFAMLSYLFAASSGRLWPDSLAVVYGHYFYFLTFLLGLTGFYLLCLRFMGRWSAVGATLLFNTQPLFWGHAFINPKDTPFMTIFLWAILLGLRMVESDLPEDQTKNQIAWLQASRKDWRDFSRKTITRLQLLGSGVMGSLLLFVLSKSAVLGWLGQLARVILRTGESHPGYAFMRSVAGGISTTNVPDYINKASILYDQSLLIFAVLGMVGFVLYLACVLPNGRQTLLQGLLDWHRYWIPAGVYGAGLVLGLCTAVRVVGPAAGGLVALMYLGAAGWRAIPGLVVYFGVAGGVAYALWPFLWGAPILRFFESLTVMSDFPAQFLNWVNGEWLASHELPWTHFPQLLLVQMTIPLLVLAGTGFLVYLRRFKWRASAMLTPSTVLILWFLVPFIGIMVFRPGMYDNFRQFFFILPPLFLMAGFGLDWCLTKIRGKLLKFLFVLAVALPGAVNIYLLHPYEYVYYNRLAGPPPTAYQNYELDYWATSYREAVLFLNEYAEENARVYFWGADYSMRPYGRPDLIQAWQKLAYDDPVDYAVLSSRYNTHLEFFPESPIIYSITRNGVVLAVVKRVIPAQPPLP